MKHFEVVVHADADAGVGAGARSVEVELVQEEEHARSLQEGEDNPDIVLEGNVLVEGVAAQQVAEADNYIVVDLRGQQDLMAVRVLHKALVAVHSDLVGHLHLGVDLHWQRIERTQVRTQLGN